MQKKPERDEYRLLRTAFGENWKAAVIERLNVYDLTRQWPGYVREDGLGVFAAAVLKQQVPVIGHGKTATKMAVKKSAVYAHKELLDKTRGIAGYLNAILEKAGLPPRVWENKEELVNLFLNFSQEFQRDLATVALFSAVVDFYNNLTRAWVQWIGADNMPGRISPGTIWGNYKNYELEPQRDELETVIQMHTEEAVNVFLDLHVINACSTCAAPASLMCEHCRAVYCSPKCQTPCT
jgi:hypothetical protein